ncbi:MAG: DNA-binding protein [Sulfolobaceae archaeon]|nr:DNA-binding protein [Sulfolobaceae archaeon]
MKNISEILVTRNKSIDDYILEAIAMFNQGYDTISLKGMGKEISKAVDIYNKLKDRLGDGVVLDSVETGSETKDKKRISYILLKLRRVY